MLHGGLVVHRYMEKMSDSSALLRTSQLHTADITTIKDSPYQATPVLFVTHIRTRAEVLI